MIKIHLKKIITCILVVLLTGCWNYRELEDQAIVTAIGIDYEKDKFNVSVSIVNPNKSASYQSGTGGDETASIIYEMEADTIREALTKMVLKSPYRMYIGHMDLLVIGEDAAKKGIYDYIDFFMRDIESRKTFTTVVAKGSKAIDVLKITEPLESIVANKLYSSFQAMSHYYGTLSNSSFEEMMMCLFATGRETTTAAVEIKGPVKKGSKTDNLSETKSNTTVEIAGISFFKNDKLIGYLSGMEVISYALMRQKLTTTTLSFKCDDKDNYANVIIDNLKASLKMTIKDDLPKPIIDITGSAALTEVNCNMDLKNPKTIDKLQDLVNKEIIKHVSKTIKKTQTMNSDIWGFEEQLWRNKNKEWKKIEKNWDVIFPQIKPKISSKIKIERISSTVNTVKRKVK